MGDVNQYAFIEKHASVFQPPFLEIGSRDYGNTQDLRSLFAPGAKYVGVDMSPGPGVDVVCDLTRPLADVASALGEQSFGAIFCLSVLEHCARPFAMAENLTALLAPGGVACLSVPFAWQFHGYPSDYWRFTHEGLKQLFPDLEFPTEWTQWSTSRPGESGAVDEEIGKRSLSTKRGGRAVPAWAGSWLLRALSKTPVGRWALDYPYVMAPTMITMIGRRPG